MIMTTCIACGQPSNNCTAPWGLFTYLNSITQGVAPGWFVVGPVALIRAEGS